MKAVALVVSFGAAACARGPISPQPRNGLIAYTAVAPTTGLRQIFVVDGQGRDPRQLTFAGESVFPSWSRDGSILLFSSRRGGWFEIHSMRADGADAKAIATSAPGDKFLAQLSPDGARIAFAAVDPAIGHPEIWTMMSSGGDARRLTTTPRNAKGPTWSLFPRFSPDGRRIAYASTASGSTQIWIMDAEGSRQTRLTFGLGAEFPDANAPSWAPRGDRIVFWAGFEGRHGEIWSMDPEGKNARQLTDQPGPISSDNPTWSPDGNNILFDTNRGGTAEIWVMESDGSDQRMLISIGIPGTQFSWQPVYSR